MPYSTKVGLVLENAAIEELNSQFGVSNPHQLADHLMYFLPPGIQTGYSTGVLGGGTTLFDDGWYVHFGLLFDFLMCFKLVLIQVHALQRDWAWGHMHEIGHNLGMYHSGDVSGEYGDESCIMGGEGFSESGPLLCYNAAKSWQMGWHASRNYVYNFSDGVWNGRIIGQDDYSNGNDDTSKIFLKLNTPGPDDYYVMFNHIATGSMKSMNLVMIARAGGEGIIASQSTIVARIGSGESAILPYFHLWESVELMVNEIDLNANPAYADVTVKMRCLYNCGATLETWTGIEGGTIADLEGGTNNLADPPQKSELLQNLLEAPSNVDENYGSRMSGWLMPPVTGDYVFWIASDEDGQLLLSSNDDPANKSIVCRQPFATAPRQWDEYEEQKSGTIFLVAGQAYYYEVRLVCGGSV